MQTLNKNIQSGGKGGTLTLTESTTGGASQPVEQNYAAALHSINS